MMIEREKIRSVICVEYYVLRFTRNYERSSQNKP